MGIRPSLLGGPPPGSEIVGGDPFIPPRDPSPLRDGDEGKAPLADARDPGKDGRTDPREASTAPLSPGDFGDHNDFPVEKVEHPEFDEKSNDQQKQMSDGREEQ